MGKVKIQRMTNEEVRKKRGAGVMLKKITKFVTERLDSVNTVEDQTRSHSVEVIGKYRGENVLINMSMLTYPELPKDKGFLKETVKGTMKYHLTKEEERFIKECYCYRHMDGRQISRVSGIQQEAIYRHIRHDKLKPVHDKAVTKKQRNLSFDSVEDFLK